jgi:hypothetical protein
MGEAESAPKVEDSPIKTHSAWAETAKAGLLIGAGVAESAQGTAMLLNAAKIRVGIETAFNVVQQMGAAASPELIRQVADNAAHLPEVAGGLSFLCAAGFFGFGTLQVFRTLRRSK